MFIFRLLVLQDGQAERVVRHTERIGYRVANASAIAFQG
jgi:hypothetical protein